MGQCNGNATFLGTCGGGETPVCAHICKQASPENMLTTLPKKGEIVKLLESSKLAEVIEIDESRLLPICVRTLEGRARWCTKERMEYVRLTQSQIERLRAEIATAAENEVPEITSYSEAVDAHRNMVVKQERDDMALPSAVICREVQVENKQQKTENGTGVSLLDVHAISQKLQVSSASTEDKALNFKAETASNTSAPEIPGVDVKVEAEVHKAKPVCQADIVPNSPIERSECSGNLTSSLNEASNDTSIPGNDTAANAASDSKVPKLVESDIEFSEFMAAGTNSIPQNSEITIAKQECHTESDFPCKAALDSEFEFTEFVSAVAEQPTTAMEEASQKCETVVLGIRSDAALSALAELVSSELEKTQPSREHEGEQIHHCVGNQGVLISSEIPSNGTRIENSLESNVPSAVSLKEDFATSTMNNEGPTSLADKNAANLHSLAQGAIITDVEAKMLDVSAVQSSLLACGAEQVSKTEDLASGLLESQELDVQSSLLACDIEQLSKPEDLASGLLQSQESNVQSSLLACDTAQISKTEHLASRLLESQELDVQSSLPACDTEQVSRTEDLECAPQPVPDLTSVSLEAPLEEPLIFDEDSNDESSGLHAVNPASLEHTPISHDKTDAEPPVVNEPKHGDGGNVSRRTDVEFDTI